MSATHASEQQGWTIYVWLIYLAFFMLSPAAKPNTTVAEWIATGVGLAIFLPLYFRGFRVCDGDLYVVIAAIALLGLIYYPFNPGAGVFFIYAASFAGHARSGALAVRGIVIIELLVIAESALFRVEMWNAVWPIVFVAIVGAVNVHYSQLGRSNHKLRLAQEEIERLAKIAERERIARDLHDLLGHTLSLIILKSELASKLADRDPQRAGAEIRDVERISRDALAQVRQAVGGYRAGGLAAEITGAKEILRAASIECSTDIAAISLSPSIESILALAVREAVTNVVRHSGAARCEIRLARADREVQLIVADDGRGAGGADGFGLTGMRERITALGGTVQRDISHGTRLIITVPLDRALERSA